MSQQFGVICKQCNIFGGTERCNSCSYVVCGHPACVTSFPHYNNTIWLVCNSCNETITKKIKPYRERLTQEDEAVMGLLMLSC